MLKYSVKIFHVLFQYIILLLLLQGVLMKFLANRKLATRISIITTVITFTGMVLLWFVVSSRVASMVEGNITN